MDSFQSNEEAPRIGPQLELSGVCDDDLPQFPSEKWELTYLGPGGLASVFCLP